jgi:hypothetical protein
VVATEVSYWISLQKQSPVIGVILTHKDKLPRQQRSPGGKRNETQRCDLLAKRRKYLHVVVNEGHREAA